MNRIPSRFGYISRKDAIEGEGVATLYNGYLGVHAPINYNSGSFIDPQKATGYTHPFLRIFQSVMLGRWNNGIGEVVNFNNLKTIIYVLLEEPGFRGLRCAGAISLAKARNGFTFAYFPSVTRTHIKKREVDHFSAHIRFSNGKILLNEVHAKVREENETYSKENRPLANLKFSDHHFAFEQWIKDITFLDPAGYVLSYLQTRRSPGDEYSRLQGIIDSVPIKTIGCSAPTFSGLISTGPICIRVGILTHRGIEQYGDVLKAISEPYAFKRARFSTRVHRIRNISLVDREWPNDVSMFVEVGLLPFFPSNDYMFSDLKQSDFVK
jgi:hypothetical protein